MVAVVLVQMMSTWVISSINTSGVSALTITEFPGKDKRKHQRTSLRLD